MKVAAIDIGSNSVHMIVAEARGGHSFEVIDREKEMVFLGRSVFDQGHLADDAFEAGVSVVERYVKLAQRHGVAEYLAVATSATREADNGGDFLYAIARRTGLQVRVITGEEEANYIYLAVRHAVDLAEKSALIFDVGGGSVEVIVGDARRLRRARSVKLGVQRLRALFGRGGPLGRRERKELEAHVRALALPAIREARGEGYDQVVGTSGTILALGQAALALGGVASGPSPTGQVVTLAELAALTERLVGATPLERVELCRVDARRADSLHVGGVLLCSLLELAGHDRLVLCDAALREGIVLDYLARQSASIRAYDVVRDIRRHSVVELMKRCGQVTPHPEHVARLALQLFDGTQELHQRGDRERRLLELGSLLHDVGQLVGYERHEHHAAYIIRNGDLRGFEDEEREIIALLARYHRKSRPRASSDPDFARLGPRRRDDVRLLAGMLRLADGLDRSHHQVVRRLEVRLGPEELTVRCHTAAEDVELELWGARRKARLLERQLGVRVQLEVVSQSGVSAGVEAARG